MFHELCFPFVDMSFRRIFVMASELSAQPKRVIYQGTIEKLLPLHIINLSVKAAIYRACTGRVASVVKCRTSQRV
jgi:hypothetical protein